MTVPAPSPSDRVRLRRGAHHGRYDRADVTSVLDAGLVAHVGVATDDGPVVIPMAYGHDGDRLLLHGAAANGALGAAIGADVCVTVTVVDGFIVGRSAFHNSMRYRSVVVRGVAERVPDEHQADALRTISDHVVETWATGRPPADTELRRTLVIAVALGEASAKIRSGDPTDEPGDVETDHWAGAVPIEARWGPLEPTANLRAGITAPPAVVALRGQPVSPPLVVATARAVHGKDGAGEHRQWRE